MFFYCEQIKKGHSVIAGDEAHHIIHVLRLRTGDSLKVFDGKGITAAATISKIAKDKLEIDVDDIQSHKAKTSGRVIIAASVAKGERFDWMVGKCTELGVDVIWPVLFERTVKQARGHSLERYNKIALAAAKQCQRPFLPVIEPPAVLAECLKRIKSDYENASLLFGSMDETAESLFKKVEFGRDYAAFVGPEGGITRSEEEILKNFGAVGVRLTDTILRTETAAETFAAILCTGANRRD